MLMKSSGLEFDDGVARGIFHVYSRGIEYSARFIIKNAGWPYRAKLVTPEAVPNTGDIESFRKFLVEYECGLRAREMTSWAFHF